MRIAAAVVTAAPLLAGCGGNDTGTVSSSPNLSAESGAEASDGVVVDIAVKDGAVTPSDPEQEFEIGKGNVEKSFTIDTPGQIAVEAHHLDVTIVQLVVRS